MLNIYKHHNNTTHPLCYFHLLYISFILPMNKEVLLKDLGEKIRLIRKDKGITQVQLAHSIGKDQQSIQRLEAGNINPSYIYLQEIADGLNIPLLDLLSKSLPAKT